jgi:reverse gyrase
MNAHMTPNTLIGHESAVRQLMIVESPNKVAKIASFLGTGRKVHECVPIGTKVVVLHAPTLWMWRLLIKRSVPFGDCSCRACSF